MSVSSISSQSISDEPIEVNRKTDSPQSSDDIGPDHRCLKRHIYAPSSVTPDSSASTLTSDSSLPDLSAPINHATSLLRRLFTEGFLLIRLAFRLFGYLGIGWKWSMQLMRLVLYAMLLMPGFIQMIAFYFFSPRVIRSVVYGPKPRQRLDLYLPKDRASTPGPWPVVIYVTGGAWTIGYKAWGSLLARRLSGQGVMVACLDYRNFPQGDALDMLEDVNCGIEWVLLRIHRHGGDPDCVTLVGQSAGGHLAGLALVRQAQQAATGRPGPGARPAWHPAGLRAFVGVSAALDLRSLADHLHSRGLYHGLLDRIMSLKGDFEEWAVGGTVRCVCAVGSDAEACNGACNGAARNGNGVDDSSDQRPRGPAYSLLSPLEAARSLPPGAASVLPLMLLIHGTHDKTVPAAGSMLMAQALQNAGASCRLMLVSGKTHTSFLLEDPMRGGTDLLTDTVLEAAAGSKGVESLLGTEPLLPTRVYRTLCPGVLCDMASRVCPF